MSKLISLSTVLVFVFASTCIVSAAEKREAKPRFKGVEMYSWKGKDGGWKFALLDGSNVQKTEQEIKRVKIVHNGADAAAKAISLLAEGEQVIWGSHRCPGFELPDDATQKAIEKAAADAKVLLVIDKE